MSNQPHYKVPGWAKVLIGIACFVAFIEMLNLLGVTSAQIDQWNQSGHAFLYAFQAWLMSLHL